MVQMFLLRLDAVVDIRKNGVESERVRGPPFTQCGMGFAPFMCRFKADLTSSLILGKFSSLLEATWMVGKNESDSLMCVEDVGSCDVRECRRCVCTHLIIWYFL